MKRTYILLLLSIFTINLKALSQTFCPASYTNITPNCSGNPSSIYVYTGKYDYSVAIEYGDGTFGEYVGYDGLITEHTFPPQNSGEVKTYTMSISVQLFDPESGYSYCSENFSQTLNVYHCDAWTCANRDLESGYSRWNFHTNRLDCSSNCFEEGPISGDHDLLPESLDAVDPYAGFPITPMNGGTILKLGNDNNEYERYVAQYNPYSTGEHVLITPENALLGVRFAVVSEGVQQGTTDPRLQINVVHNEGAIQQCGFPLFRNGTTPGFQKVPGENVYFLNWTTLFWDLTEYIGEHVNIDFILDKAQSPTGEVFFAYAYIDIFCGTQNLTPDVQACAGEPNTFAPTFETGLDGDAFIWNMGDGTQYSTREVTHTFTNPGTYTVSLWYNPPFLPVSPDQPEPDDTYTILKGSKESIEIIRDNTNLFQDLIELVNRLPPLRCGGVIMKQVVTVTDCGGPPFVCETCIPPFSPLPGEKYILTAWTRQGDGIGYSDFIAPAIQIDFLQGSSTPAFKPKGMIIDGWQRISGEFIVPIDAENIWINLKNESSVEPIYFDDIRIQPFDSSLKSFVYDPVSLRMVAELDERNFATFFEYDEEGALVRVKKETERGIKTISETRISTRKRTNNN